LQPHSEGSRRRESLRVRNLAAAVLLAAVLAGARAGAGEPVAPQSQERAAGDRAVREDTGDKANPKLLFSTTFDCPEWKTSDGGHPVPGMVMHGGWKTRPEGSSAGGHEEQVTADANFPGGGGGKGQRHWEGDGSNNNSGGIAVRLKQIEPELWIRWYMRYEKGFAWKNGRPYYDKILYIWGEEISVKGARGCQIIPEWYGADQFSLSAQGSGDDFQCCKLGTGWKTVMGSNVSDGKWHCYEIHIKASSGGKKDGIGELWIDDVQRYSFKDAYLPTKGWIYILFGSNQSEPENGRDMYVDYDDIAVSSEGRIGPLALLGRQGAESKTP
jgi:hypothetical protein